MSFSSPTRHFPQIEEWKELQNTSKRRISVETPKRFALRRYYATKAFNLARGKGTSTQLESFSPSILYCRLVIQHTLTNDLL